MIWVLYLLTTPIAMAIAGRIFANEYKETPRKSGQMSAMTCGFFYGLIWPLSAVLFVLAVILWFILDGIKKSKGFMPFLRLVFTGTREKT